MRFTLKNKYFKLTSTTLNYKKNSCINPYFEKLKKVNKIISNLASNYSKTLYKTNLPRRIVHPLDKVLETPQKIPPNTLIFEINFK